MAFVYPSVAVEAELSSGVWTDVWDDVSREPLRIAYGINGDGPLDCVAGTGSCQLALHNSTKAGSGRPLGYYSPQHASVRPGWGIGTPLRVRLSDGGSWRTKHRGKVWAIDPDAGQYGPRQAHVVSYDGMRDIAEADVRELAVQFDQSESVLANAILDALPADAQPLARDIDAGVDTYPYAFHDVGPGAKGLALLTDVAHNAFALIAMKGDGTLIMRSRNTRATGASAATFDNSMHTLRAPSDADKTFTTVRITIHPVTSDAAATTVLWAATGTPPSIPAGQSLVLWAEYRDPANTTTLIGGRDIVNPMVAGTDYVGNSQADGLGAVLTGSLSVTIEPFASTAKITVTNNHATSTIYLVNGAGQTVLQVRGKGLYDRGPQTYQASSSAKIARFLDIDLGYQSNPSITQSYATYLHAQYSTLANRVGEISFLANYSAAHMTQALDREPGDIITVTEPVTGLALVEAVIQSVELVLTGGGVLWCRWGLAPAAPFKAWVLGVAGRSELGSTTRLGF